MSEEKKPNKSSDPFNESEYLKNFKDIDDALEENMRAEREATFGPGAGEELPFSSIEKSIPPPSKSKEGPGKRPSRKTLSDSIEAPGYTAARASSRVIRSAAAREDDMSTHGTRTPSARCRPGGMARTRTPG